MTGIGTVSLPTFTLAPIQAQKETLKATSLVN